MRASSPRLFLGMFFYQESVKPALGSDQIGEKEGGGLVP